MTFSEKKLADCIVIFDEIDRCYLDKILTFSKIKITNNFTIKYSPKILGICKQVIGFTVTFGTSTVN